MDRMNGAVVKNESRYLTGRNHEEGLLQGSGFPRNLCIVLHRKNIYIYMFYMYVVYIDSANLFAPCWQHIGLRNMMISWYHNLRIAPATTYVPGGLRSPCWLLSAIAVGFGLEIQPLDGCNKVWHPFFSDYLREINNIQIRARLSWAGYLGIGIMHFFYTPGPKEYHKALGLFWQLVAKWSNFAGGVGFRISGILVSISGTNATCINLL